jgi:hypothetical protein
MLRFNSEIVQRLLMITKLPQVMEVAPDVASGLQLILGHPVELPTRLKFEDRYSVTLEKDGGDRKLVVKDSTVDPPQSTHYEVRDVPPSPPERLSILGMAGVVFSALAVLAVLVFGLVWVTKQISSIPLLVLIFCVALLFSLCLLGLVLLLSGLYRRESWESCSAVSWAKSRASARGSRGLQRKQRPDPCLASFTK